MPKYTEMYKKNTAAATIRKNSNITGSYNQPYLAYIFTMPRIAQRRIVMVSCLSVCQPSVMLVDCDDMT